MNIHELIAGSEHLISGPSGLKTGPNRLRGGVFFLRKFIQIQYIHPLEYRFTGFKGPWPDSNSSSIQGC
jgi:hypothetical protein